MNSEPPNFVTPEDREYAEMKAEIARLNTEIERLNGALDGKSEQIARLKEQVAKVLEGFDRKIFVRNIEDDGASDWAVKCFPYLRALGILAESLPLAATEEKP